MNHREYIVPIGDEAEDYDEIFIGVLRKHKELVRCKDCMWYVIDQLKSDETPDRRYKPTFCELHRTWMPSDGYCSVGKEDKECTR